MKKFITNIFFFIVLLLLGLASIYGVLVLDRVPIRGVGVMQFSAFKNGLSFYQGNRPYFYTISPFNDYFTTSDGVRSSFFSKDEIAENKFSTNYHTSHLLDIQNAIAEYFNSATPQITFFGENKEIEYYSESSNNTLTIIRRLKTNGNNPQVLGMTFTYYGMDFIYDKVGNLYIYQNEEDVANFEKLYGVQLTLQTEEFRIPIPGKTIAIMNPYLAGVLLIRVSDSQTLWVNRNTKMIEIEENVQPHNGYYTTAFKVEVYKDPGDAQKYL